MFDNDNGSVANLTAALFFSLIFSSCVISYMCLNMGINQEIPVVKGMEGIESYNVSENIEVTHDSEWIQNELGYVTTSNIITILFLGNIQLSNGKVTNYYQINNSVQAPYDIVIEAHDKALINSFQIRSDGIHVPNCKMLDLCIGDITMFPIADADKIKEVNIKTDYDKTNHKATITFNGISYSVSDLADSTTIPVISTTYYGGVKVSKEGFNLKSIDTDNIINTNISNPLDLLVSFIWGVFAITVWNLDPSIFPWELNLILIKSQCTALVICVVVIIRGGGI